MLIIIDGDACPVINQTTDICTKNQVDMVIVTDITRVINNEYAKVIYVDKAQDSADFKILSIANQDSIVITNDTELASLALSKKAQVVNFYGTIIDIGNIDSFVTARYLNMKARQQKKRLPNIKKRSVEDNLNYVNSLNYIIKNSLK